MMLLHSKSGDLAALWRRMQMDGFPVAMYVDKAFHRRKRLYRGLVPQFDSWDVAAASRPEAIVFDMVGYGERADDLRRHIPIWGAGRAQDCLELNRGHGFAIMQQAGIRIPHTVIFNPQRGVPAQSINLTGPGRLHWAKGHVAEARRFVLASGIRWVLKPYGHAVTSLTYVAKSPEDMDRRLGEVEDKQEIKPDHPFILQAFVQGTEISTEIWVQHGEIIPELTNWTIETKRFMNGDVGSNTGCQTSAVGFYRNPRTPIFQKTMGLPGFLQWLRQPTGPDGETFLPYHGPLDFNQIISDSDGEPYGLEWTPRHGYSAIYALAELIDESFYDLWLRAAQGRLRNVRTRQGVGFAVRVSIPPYPGAEEFDDKKDPQGFAALMELETNIAILGPTDDRRIWLLDAKLEKGKMVTAGADGVILEATGRGPTIDAAARIAYAMVKRVQVAEAQYRTDGAEDADKRLRKVLAKGYEGP